MKFPQKIALLEKGKLIATLKYTSENLVLLMTTFTIKNVKTDNKYEYYEII